MLHRGQNLEFNGCQYLLQSQHEAKCHENLDSCGWLFSEPHCAQCDKKCFCNMLFGRHDRSDGEYSGSLWVSCVYIAVPLKRHQFSSKPSLKTPHSSPVRARYGCLLWRQPLIKLGGGGGGWTPGVGGPDPPCHDTGLSYSGTLLYLLLIGCLTHWG